jgi:hypothetical protein
MQDDIGKKECQRYKKEPVVGIEPTADALRKHCSTAELHRHGSYLSGFYKQFCEASISLPDAIDYTLEVSQVSSIFLTLSGVC